jgi:hypothetical protein
MLFHPENMNPVISDLLYTDINIQSIVYAGIPDMIDIAVLPESSRIEQRVTRSGNDGSNLFNRIYYYENGEQKKAEEASAKALSLAPGNVHDDYENTLNRIKRGK